MWGCSWKMLTRCYWFNDECLMGFLSSAALESNPITIWECRLCRFHCCYWLPKERTRVMFDSPWKNQVANMVTIWNGSQNEMVTRFKCDSISDDPWNLALSVHRSEMELGQACVCWICGSFLISNLKRCNCKPGPLFFQLFSTLYSRKHSSCQLTADNFSSHLIETLCILDLK